MSHDLNLINANYTTHLRPPLLTHHHHQNSFEHSSSPLTPSLPQNLYSFTSSQHNPLPNHPKSHQKPGYELNQAITQNHLALKNLIELIDGRKTKSTLTGLSFNNQRSNRFKRKSSEQMRRQKNNFVQDLREVKQKMGQIMRLIDIKIKVNQYQHTNTIQLYDFDEIKEKLTFQSAKLDVLQKDNVEGGTIYLPKWQDHAFDKYEAKGSQSREIYKPTMTGNEHKNNQTTDDQEYLHLKHSFDKLNDVHFYQEGKLGHTHKDQIVLPTTIMHNQLNSTNLVQFFSNDRRQVPNVSILKQTENNSELEQHTPNKSEIYHLSEINQTHLQVPLAPQPKKTQQPAANPRSNAQHALPSSRVVRFQRPMSVDNKINLTTYHPQITVNYSQPQLNMRASNYSTRLLGHQNRFYNPNSFGRPVSNINPNLQQPIINRIPPQMPTMPPVSRFSPPPNLSPSLPFRSQQKGIIRQWDEESRPELSFGFSSSVSTHRNGESGNNLKKSSKKSQKFSFIEHFANNPDARKKREEPMIQTDQAKQSLVQYGFPNVIPRQQTQKLKNPFEQWNERQKMQPRRREQELRINESIRTVLETSEHKNKNSIIHQTSFFQSSKSGSKPANRDLHQTNVLVTGSAYKKKKKGLEVSQRMNQTHYYTKH